VTFSLKKVFRKPEPAKQTLEPMTINKRHTKKRQNTQQHHGFSPKQQVPGTNEVHYYTRAIAAGALPRKSTKSSAAEKKVRDSEINRKPSSIKGFSPKQQVP